MELDFSKLNPQELRDIFGNTFGGGTGNSGAGNNTSAGNNLSSGNPFLDIIAGFRGVPSNYVYTPPAVDSTFSSGLNYAQSIAGGQNVPGMIAPGVSYSSAMPGGYTTSAPVQAPIQTPPPGFGTPPPIQPPIDFPPIDPPINIGGPVEPPVNIGGPVTDPVIPPIDFPPINFPPIDFPPINIGGPVGGPIPDPVMPPIDPPFGVPKGNPFEYDPPINIGGPVDLPGIGGPSMIPIPPKQKDQLFIDDIPRFEDIPSTDYVVPQVPLNNLLNQNPPQGPVGMSPQETAKMSSQQELLNLISNKDILKEIPADDGVRNQYQVELDEYINKSPINMDTYKEELPIGSAINLGIPAVMETVVPMAVPGLSLAKNISDSLSSNNNPSPASRPSTPSVSRPSRSGIDYSSVKRFGR